MKTAIRRPKLLAVVGCALWLGSLAAVRLNLVVPSLWTGASYMLGWLIATSAGAVLAFSWLGISTKRAGLIFIYPWSMLMIIIGLGLPWLSAKL